MMLNNAHQGPQARGIRDRTVPIRRSNLPDIITAAPKPRTGPSGREEDPSDSRWRAVVDIALLLVMYEAALRPGEAANLRRSKLSRVGSIWKITLPDGSKYRLSDHASDALTKVPGRVGIVGHRFFDLTAAHISRRIRDAAAAGGLPGCTGLSPRVGKLFDLDEQGASVQELAAFGRLSPSAVRRLRARRSESEPKPG